MIEARYFLHDDETQRRLNLEIHVFEQLLTSEVPVLLVVQPQHIRYWHDRLGTKCHIVSPFVAKAVKWHTVDKTLVMIDALTAKQTEIMRTVIKKHKIPFGVVK